MPFFVRHVPVPSSRQRRIAVWTCTSHKPRGRGWDYEVTTPQRGIEGTFWDVQIARNRRSFSRAVPAFFDVGAMRQLPHISAPWRAAMTTEGDSSVENSSSDDEAIAPKTKRSLRGVLLQYMLYDAFIRPTA